MTRAERLLAHLARDRERGHGGAVVVIDAPGIRRATLLPLLRAGDALLRGSTSARWIIAVLDPPRAGVTRSPADLRVIAARLEAALRRALRAGAAPEIGWIDGETPLPATLAAVEEEALRRGRLEWERRALFRAVGHELRTPLTSARGYLELLLSDPPRRRADARRFLEIAQRETLRAARLVDGLFELSLLETGSAPLRRGKGDLASVARAALESLTLEARRRKLDLYAVLGRAPAELDEERTTQAVLNLVHNAIKFARGAVWVETTLGEAGAELIVDDDGPGFSEADMRAGPAFGRRGSASLGVGGSGVGLALAAAVAALHGGAVALERSPRGGARVRLALPAGQDRRGAVSPRRGSKARVRPPE